MGGEHDLGRTAGRPCRSAAAAPGEVRLARAAADRWGHHAEGPALAELDVLITYDQRMLADARALGLPRRPNRPLRSRPLT